MTGLQDVPPQDAASTSRTQASDEQFRLGWILPVGLALLLVAILTLLTLLLLNPPWEDTPVPDIQDRLSALSKSDLEVEKLRQETVKLELENRSAGSGWGLLLSYAPFLTAIVAVAGLFATVWKQISTSAQQRIQDRHEQALENQRRFDQRIKDRHEQALENQRRFDQNFTKVVENLGSASPALQASAAVSLATFLRPEYSRFHDQVYMVVLANLKIEHEQPVNDLLVNVFEQSIRLRLPSASQAARRYLLDLSRASLDRVDLSGLDLQEADLGYARMRGANLTGTNLFRCGGIAINLERARLTDANLEEARLREARCRGALFHRANLVSARLEEAQLIEAQFEDARLQGAHLQRAALQGARFWNADINDAFFADAMFDSAALKSIAKGAKNWRNAHFTAAVSEKLNAISDASASHST